MKGLLEHLELRGEVPQSDLDALGASAVDSVPDSDLRTLQLARMPSWKFEAHREAIADQRRFYAQLNEQEAAKRERDERDQVAFDVLLFEREFKAAQKARAKVRETGCPTILGAARPQSSAR